MATGDANKRVIITRKVPTPLSTLLEEYFEVWMHDSIDPLPPDKLGSSIRGTDAIGSIADDRIADTIYESAGPRLTIAANSAIGCDNIDVEVSQASRASRSDASRGNVGVGELIVLQDNGPCRGVGQGSG